MYLKNGLYLLTALLLLMGCSASKVNKLPLQTEVGSTWHTTLKNPVVKETDNPELLKTWWTLFNDQTLNNLIDKAVQSNQDLKSAYYAYTAARATLKKTEAESLPALSASGSVKKTRYGDTALQDQEIDSYATGLDVSWEIDLFSRLQNTKAATLADMQAANETLHDVMVSLLAELATKYINVRSLQHRLEITEEDIRIKQELYELASRKYQSGLSDTAEVQTALYNLEYAKTKVHDLKISLEAAYNHLAVLTGQKPGTLHDLLSIRANLPLIPEQIVTGIPADMIRRRPDIREAERNLAAQTARIGVAEADRYPTFTLTGSLGYQADTAGSLFNSSNSTFAVGPSFSWAIFDLGAVKQNIKVQTEKQKQYLATYETAVLTALEEVENAMTSVDQEYLKNAQMQKAYDSAALAYDLALKKYQAGLSDFADVITAETSYITYKDELLQSTATVTIYVISLYKAMGGGWESFKPYEQP